MVDDRRSQVAPLQDNYAEFTGKIDAAREKLQKRFNSLVKSLELVQEVLDNSTGAHSQWERRHASLKSMVAAYNGGDEGLKHLNDFLMTAERMESASSHQADLVRARRDDMQATHTEIQKALNELDEAKSKLELSRYESNARSSLSHISSSITSPDLPPVDTNVELQGDITQARLAIASAEALVEIKGTSRG